MKVMLTKAGTIASPNGKSVTVWQRKTNGELFICFKEIYEALGYKSHVGGIGRLNTFYNWYLKPYQVRATFLGTQKFTPLTKVRDVLVEFSNTYSYKKCTNSDARLTAKTVCNSLPGFIANIDTFLAENKHNHSSTSNANMSQIELPLLCDSITEPSTQKGDDTLNYVNAVLKQPFQIPGMCGRGIFDVYSGGKKSYLKPSDIARALGYSQFNANSSLLSTALKNAKISLCVLRDGNQLGIYLIDFDLVVPWLKAFCQATLAVVNINHLSASLRDDARMYAERMIAYLEAHPELIHGDNAIVSDKKEDSQMENITQQNAYDVTTITVQDFEDINTRAEAIVKFFGSSKKDALRAAITLKAQEVNRDLAPLIELLG